ncbi:TlyA family RNA methyltransferase [Vagococcus lutrae]|uniref:TlyA family RNA methyltransferase n=1 Tax=Vagococcus lutrae TaxID=81947 RepID=UPI001927AFDB|nr:TlyA family RNA methyltransferase [Vagococcus lutrae]MDT2817284.1 TlyA family RNA methyltransferase [Vagococcus lutrae]MDT2841528.1 TlyA family RNA methyltransferase [Vagococcus lutrae]MDY3706019.1 TlyA family RNA methyltransferase [Vagococcus lutrae]QZN88606.1 TlyA family RNA methyltransferase [Vagococcus lutrae]UQF70545.1 TlyA family RNA methyltransferase [Vagococcus lutrae]
MKKERADILAYQQGLAETREQAKRLIMAGKVYDELNERIDKPGTKLASDTMLQLKGEGPKYVSRGGLKLEKALKVFSIDMQDKIVLDIGASTGGFTDVALQAGAVKSYALDVGYNQLSWKLRQDDRVIVMERMNFRYAKPEDFTEGVPQVATIDVSFISLKLILPVLKTILAVDGEVVCLVKPQFEAGKENVGKKGIIKDPAVHQMVLEEMLDFMLNEGYLVKGVSYSPVKGGEGNIEFLVHLVWPKASEPQRLQDNERATIVKVVEEAHQQLTDA